MYAPSELKEALIAKIRDLPDHRVAQVDDFVDFLHAREQSDGVARLNKIYDEYIKPVEDLHPGEYAAVTPDGQTFFAPSLLEAMEKAGKVSETNNSLFKVGEIAAVRIL